MSGQSDASESSRDDTSYMRQAIELAMRAEGHVEPNPMVGCVIVSQGSVAEGWHRKFGGPHAEAEALQAAGAAAQGATMYVTLEPCCHHGKTPPCADAIVAAGIRRVVIAQVDPFQQVSGGGIKLLQEAGLQVEVGLLAKEASQLNAPFFKLVQQKRPWVIAKWAMTLDGKIAASTGHSRWITSESSRAIVHQLRGRVDAVMVGSHTAAVDDPLLTARPPGIRVPLRVVVDSKASLSLQSQLVKTARQTPVLIATGPDASADKVEALTTAGVEVFTSMLTERSDRLAELLDELGRRQMTNVLVEGGARLLGNLFDLDAIDEVHVFVAPKLVGGQDAPSPLAGTGLPQIPTEESLELAIRTDVGVDTYIRGRLRR